MVAIDLTELHREVRELRDHYPYHQPDNLFVLWYLKAFVAKDEADAEAALLGGAKDKGVDAIYVDPEGKAVHIIQGKYHKGRPPAKLADVITLGDLGRAILSDSSAAFDAAVGSANPAVGAKLQEARRKVRRDGYRIHLRFVTTGTVSPSAANEAALRVDDWPDQADYDAVGAAKLVRLLQDYIQGAAPPVPMVHLEVRTGQIFAKNHKNGVTASVASIDASSLARMVQTYGVRVFARNIRGFLGIGDSQINSGIAQTLKNEPDNFWYFNNGLTIVCDEAKATTKGGRTLLSIKNGQIINGQQTTRVISEADNVAGASVLVKVIEISRDTKEEQRRYNSFINQVVRATNWQNPISIADLRTNDDEQVRIEREFRNLNYNYLRRRQAKAESRRAFGGMFRYQVKKEELAQAVAACVLDPYLVRLGKDRLFDESNYERVFASRPVAEYLTCYWLSRLNSKRSRSDPRRGYAKWVVLNQIWAHLRSTMHRPTLRRAFIHLAEQKKQGPELRPLKAAIDTLYEAALAFYRSAPDVRVRKQDESTFYKHANREVEFASFLRSVPGSRRRKLIESRLTKFSEVLSALEL